MGILEGCINSKFSCSSLSLTIFVQLPFEVLRTGDSSRVGMKTKSRSWFVTHYVFDSFGGCLPMLNLCLTHDQMIFDAQINSPFFVISPHISS